MLLLTPVASHNRMASANNGSAPSRFLLSQRALSVFAGILGFSLFLLVSVVLSILLFLLSCIRHKTRYEASSGKKSGRDVAS